MDPAVQEEIDRWRRKYDRERKARLQAEEIAERFTRDALHDSLTGLANRALFLDRLQHALDSTNRHRMPLATVLLDLNGFKEINDSYGHAVGDELLCAVARRLTEAVRSIDTVARLGGDEFAIVIEDVDEERRELVIERIRRALDVPFLLQGEPRQLGHADRDAAPRRHGDVRGEARRQDRPRRLRDCHARSDDVPPRDEIEPAAGAG